MVRIDFATFVLVFKIICGIVTLFMVGFWFNRYQKNEDVSQVNYVSLKDMDDVVHPEMTLCIIEPFLIQRLQDMVSNATIEEYLEYLNGDNIHDERYKKTNFDDVTIDIFDYLQYPVLLGHRNATVDPISCADERNCQSIEMRNSFNGYTSTGLFWKCFSISIKPQFGRDLREIALYFNSNLVEILASMQGHGVHGYRGMVVIFANYPNQVARYVDKSVIIWQTDTKKNMNNAITMAGTEILRRRNKRADPCLTSWKDFDNFAMKEHINALECITPYLKQSKPLCSSAVTMKKSRYEMEAVRDKYNPCQELSNVEIEYRELPYNYTDDKILLMIQYPAQTKIITQSQAVDLHSLIGNIGGYIGLFLGRNKTSYTT